MLLDPSCWESLLLRSSLTDFLSHSLSQIFRSISVTSLQLDFLCVILRMWPHGFISQKNESIENKPLQFCFSPNPHLHLFDSNSWFLIQNQPVIYLISPSCHPDFINCSLSHKSLIYLVLCILPANIDHTNEQQTFLSPFYPFKLSPYPIPLVFKLFGKCFQLLYRIQCSFSFFKSLPYSSTASSKDFSSVAQSCPILCDPMDCSMPGLPVHLRLLELAQTHVRQVRDAINHLILCHPLLPSIFPSVRVFSNESVLRIRWPKYWSFSISPPNEYSGLISFRIDWFDLLAVQGTLKSLLKHHSSKAPILQCSALFMVQLSHPCMTTGKTIALTRWIFVGKVMSLLFNMLSRLVITFCQGASIFYFHGCSHHLQWFWSPRK